VMLVKNLEIDVLAHREQYVIEEDALLPGLAAESQRRKASGLDLVHRREELVPIGGRSAHAGLVEHFLRIESPILPVDIDGNGIYVTLATGGCDERGRQEALPLAFFGHLIEGIEQPLADEVVELLASVELRC